MRKVKITKIDQYTYQCRDNHPEIKHQGLEGIVLRSEILNQEAGFVEETQKALRALGEEIVLTEGEDFLELLTVYLPESQEIVCLMDFEVKFL